MLFDVDIDNDDDDMLMMSWQNKVLTGDRIQKIVADHALKSKLVLHLIPKNIST